MRRFKCGQRKPEKQGQEEEVHGTRGKDEKRTGSLQGESPLLLSPIGTTPGWLAGTPGTSNCSELQACTSLTPCTRAHSTTCKVSSFPKPLQKEQSGQEPLYKGGRQEQFLTPVEDSAINKDLWPQARGHKTPAPPRLDTS